MATVMAWVMKRQRHGWGREGHAGFARAVYMCRENLYALHRPPVMPAERPRLVRAPAGDGASPRW